jgi:antitoxin (DNA-binding transcriptional repressor) of toxin-antitoxin stability system
MIIINMQQIKSRLSELVKAVEVQSETVIICRYGKPVAEIRSLPLMKTDRLTPDPDLKPVSIHYDPTEPLAADEWPFK